MKVYALVGKSGTGKSYQAQNLCRELGVSAIIDDGLFIYENRIEAGISAKRQTNIISAVKVAIFNDPEHRESVATKIKEINPDSILILGTSERMVEKIDAAVLSDEISKIIYIEDVTTEEERKIAEVQRDVLGKHVIPVPTFQIKHEFAGYFMDPLKILKGFGFHAGKSDYTEKSVVRPTFSYLGDFIISDKVFTDIVKNVSVRMDAVNSVNKIITNQTDAGVSIDISINMNKGYNISNRALDLQADIIDKIESMTAFVVEKVDIEVKGIK